MSLELIADLWSEIKRYVNVVDRSDAADTLIAVLVDHDYDSADIASVFSHDSDVRRALSSYQTVDEDEFDDYDEDDDDLSYDD